jgi:hypothetical protein
MLRLDKTGKSLHRLQPIEVSRRSGLLMKRCHPAVTSDPAGPATCGFRFSMRRLAFQSVPVNSKTVAPSPPSSLAIAEILQTQFEVARKTAAPDSESRGFFLSHDIRLGKAYRGDSYQW